MIQDCYSCTSPSGGANFGVAVAPKLDIVLKAKKDILEKIEQEMPNIQLYFLPPYSPIQFS
ncbi:MAG: hypothetical protein KME55_36555 [Nostoc indistinguendum CM1-VF10]|jgi:hypothetical protein|nr:hypothetical protein [Nostoc indistinguendum CM1-VF10]